MSKHKTNRENEMAYARHIKNGRLMDYAVASNKALDREVKARLRCAACGRLFSESVKQQPADKSLCTDCVL